MTLTVLTVYLYPIKDNTEMAAIGGVFNAELKIEALKIQILRTFDAMFTDLMLHRDNLLALLARIMEGYDRNVGLEEAISQLRIARDNALNVMRSNILWGVLDSVREEFDAKIRAREEMRVVVENLEFVEFRCFSGKIRKAIEEIDLIELIPEYVGRENPVIKSCTKGRGNGEFRNPGGISIDNITNEVFIADSTNSRIQVLTTEGEYLRSFGTDHLKEPHGIFVSQDGVFVTDRATECLLRFSLAGQFINKTGSRGTTPGCFNAITGLCYETGLVYVCDFNVQRIQIFDLNLKFVKQFGYGEIKSPTDIAIYLDTLHILSTEQNTIYCYNRDGTYLKKIELTGQQQQMTAALFFTTDKKGNFIITDSSSNEIRIFSPNGVLKHILGSGHLPFIAGITLDNTINIICVCHSTGNDCFQKY